MRALTSNITIANWKLKANNVRIRKSVNQIIETCVIKVPTSSVLKYKDQPKTASMQTSKQFALGDKVIVNLGYNGTLNNEFDGFVSRLNYTSPLEIECEGYAFQLRGKSITASYEKVQLKDLLKEIVAGTDIVVDDGIDDIPLTNITIPGVPALNVLNYFKEHCYLSIYFIKNVLYAGLKYRKEGVKRKHILGWNVIKDNDLKFRKKEELNVIVNLSCEKSDGTKVKASSGKAGGKVINRVTIVDDPAWLQKIADRKLSLYDFDGYEGKITTFGVPYANITDISVLEDRKYPDRSGSYFIESMDVVYGLNGFRRIIELGLKVG